MGRKICSFGGGLGSGVRQMLNGIPDLNWIEFKTIA